MEMEAPPATRTWEGETAECIGAVVQVSLATDRRHWRIASIQAFVEPPVQLRQIEFLRTPRQRAVGYATWAFLTEDSATALIADPRRVLDIDEWNEGTQLWIMDVVAPVGGLRQLLGQVRRRLPEHHRAWWLRRRNDPGGVVAHRDIGSAWSPPPGPARRA